jgi:hypothetical protein
LFKRKMRWKPQAGDICPTGEFMSGSLPAFNLLQAPFEIYPFGYRL